LNALVRGGMTIGAGIVIGNIFGFVRVAVTAYFLGTHAKADELAVAISPIDTLNAMLINTMVFAFVPMLMLREGAERTALFRAASRIFAYIFGSLTALVILTAPLLMRVLAPGLLPEQHVVAANILRITSLSTLAAGSTAICSALLFTQRRFLPSAFNQACLNAFTVVGAILLWKVAGIYGFAIGYTMGALVQFLVVYFPARGIAGPKAARLESTPWRELLAKPGAFIIFAGLISLNVIVTRAHATESGSGMAAAFDYCMRCVNVVIAYLVSPVSNSLLPEIARLGARNRSREAVRIIEKTTLLVAGAALAACVAGIIFRKPVIALMFERGNFTAESTLMVSGVFLGFAPSIVGWSLLEITSRSLFALNRPWLPLGAASIPVLFNLVFSAVMRANGYTQPEYVGLGASCGLLLAFLVLLGVAHGTRKRFDRHGGVAGERETELVGAG
jgi:putative peptidoglycan lipid II flippase